MPKNITITNVDSININDVNNFNKQSKHIKMIHEQEFENYDIDPKKVYENAGMVKSIPPEWIPEIVNENINTIKITKIHHNFNNSERSFVLGFETQESCEKFYKEFNLGLFKTTNNFIKKKDKKPEDYNRIIVLETTVDGQQLIIRY